MNYAITRRIIESGEKLRFIQSVGVGYEKIDVKAATDNGVVVMNMPTGTTVSVAEHAVALILTCAKNIVKVGERELELMRSTVILMNTAREWLMKPRSTER